MREFKENAAVGRYSLLSKSYSLLSKSHSLLSEICARHARGRASLSDRQHGIDRWIAALSLKLSISIH
jgi:hypothetical protein